MRLSDFSAIHFVGIGGIGISALAKYLHFQGAAITGSDAQTSPPVEELRRLGIAVTIGHNATNLPAQTELIIFSAAVPELNPERLAARVRGTPELSYFDALGSLSENFKTLTVSGTHGKSTTTALLGLMLEEAAFDPLVIVGSKVKTFTNGNLRRPLGATDWFVVEGCEHLGNMLKLKSFGVIVTAVELDHLDYYRDLADIQEHFSRFIRGSQGGPVIINGDDPNCAPLFRAVTANAPVTFGLAAANDYHVANLTVQSGVHSFEISRHGETLGKIELHIPGAYNVRNFLAAAAMALELGAPFVALQKTAEKFTGLWRRFENLGTWRGATVISDYGHHPTAVKETLQAAREFFPERRLVLVFQPHQHNRTKNLWKEFVKCFDLADVLILNEIYDVAGREEEKDQDVTSEKLAAEIRPRSRDEIFGVRLQSVIYAPTFEDVNRALYKEAQSGDIIIVMGAGDINKVAEDLFHEFFIH